MVMSGAEVMLTLCFQIKQDLRQSMYLRPVQTIKCFNSQMIIKNNNLLILKVRKGAQLDKMTNLS